MDKKQWSIAHDIAFDLVDWGTDPNELGKVSRFHTTAPRRERCEKSAHDSRSTVGKYAKCAYTEPSDAAVLSEHPRSL